jgi:phage terminase small subunit
MTPWHEGLTELQRRFCEVYAANGGNAMAAASEAGYRKPRQQGSENLEKPGIIAALSRLREATTSAAIATREERQSL